MKQGENNRGNPFAACHPAGGCTYSNPVNPAILSFPQVSSFQFQVSFSAAYIVRDNALWQESAQTVYPDFDSDRAVVTAKSRRKLTNLGTFVSVSESEEKFWGLSPKLSLRGVVGCGRVVQMKGDAL